MKFPHLLLPMRYFHAPGEEVMKFREVLKVVQINKQSLSS